MVLTIEEEVARLKALGLQNCCGPADVQVVLAKVAVYREVRELVLAALTNLSDWDWPTDPGRWGYRTVCLEEVDEETGQTFTRLYPAWVAAHELLDDGLKTYILANGSVVRSYDHGQYVHRLSRSAVVRKNRKQDVEYLQRLRDGLIRLSELVVA